MNRTRRAIGIVTLVCIAGWAIAKAPAEATGTKGAATMRLSKPRIAPLAESEWTDEQRKVLERFHREGKSYNVIGTWSRHWAATQKFLVWSSHVSGGSTLPVRDRELLILRTGWLCRSEYEWAQHVMHGKDVIGWTPAELERIRKGPDAPGWTPFEAALLRAADELHADSMIGDATWAALAERYETKQLMDVTFTVGQYTLVAMALNSFGVQLDQGLEGF